MLALCACENDNMTAAVPENISETAAPTTAPSTAPTILPTAAPAVSPTTAPTPTEQPIGIQPSYSASAPVSAWINGEDVNLRSGSSLDAPVLAVLSYALEITVLGSDGDWNFIQAADGTEGFVYTEYL